MISLTKLSGLGREGLKDLWRQMFDVEPASRLSPDIMRRCLAVALQKQAVKNLPKPAARRLEKYHDQYETTGRVAPKEKLRLKAGTRLVREWDGKTHMVLRHDGGFDYEGETYRSLSAVAKRITGAHWSGPRFFGLDGAGKTGEAKP